MDERATVSGKETELSLLGVFAHPDDESFGIAGTLAKYGQEGVRTGVVTATGGEAGLAAGYQALTGEALAAVRVEELRCACRLLGVGSLHLLGYEDQHLTEADPAAVERKLVGIIRGVRPLVVVTFGPEGGGSGHPDHQAISRAAAAAFAAAAEPGAYPEQLAAGLLPFQARKLYYLTRPTALGSGEAAPGFLPITTVIDITGEIDLKLAAFRCHRTQSGDYPKLVQRLADHGPKEYFYLAAGSPRYPNRIENDLFAGLR